MHDLTAWGLFLLGGIVWGATFIILPNPATVITQAENNLIRLNSLQQTVEDAPSRSTSKTRISASPRSFQSSGELSGSPGKPQSSTTQSTHFKQTPDAPSNESSSRWKTRTDKFMGIVPRHLDDQIWLNGASSLRTAIRDGRVLVLISCPEHDADCREMVGEETD